MYCLKCRRVTETENITTATSQNGRCGQCITCGKTGTQFVKRRAGGESCVNTFVNKLPFEMHLPGHNITGLVTKLYETLNSEGMVYTDKQC